MKYAIWNYFPIEVRMLVADQEYLTDEYDQRNKRNEKHQCPLGVAFNEFGEFDPSPSANLVANKLCGAFVGDSPLDVWDSIRDSAYKFMTDWDAGMIINLREAVGLID